MTPRLVLSLGVAALISVGAAAAAWQSTKPQVRPGSAGGELLPDLIDRVNAIAGIEVRHLGKTIRLQRSDGTWQVVPSGYEVRPRKLQETLVGLIRLNKLEQRTAKADKYPILQVEDSDGANSKSRHIILSDETGAEVGSVLLGKAATGYTSGAEEAQYVRLAGDATSWLVKGSVAAGAEYKDWVDTTVVQVNTGAVKAVEISQADGESLKLLKTGKTEQGHDLFTIQGLPDGVKPKDDLNVRYAATDLANVEFVDVRKTAVSGDPASRAVLETDKGLKIAYRLYREGDGNWLNVVLVAAGDDAEGAEKLKATVDGWDFAIADYKAKQFQKRLSDLLDMQQ